MENAYGMLKGRFQILYQKTECRMYNLKYVVMLHNLCTFFCDPCEPWWKLEGHELGLMRKKAKRGENKCGSDLNCLKIANCLWDK